MQSRVDDPKVVLDDLNAEQALAIYEALTKKWGGASFEIIPTPFVVVKYQVMLNTYVITYHFKEMQAFAQGVCAGLARDRGEDRQGQIVARSTFSYSEQDNCISAFASDIARVGQLPEVIYVARSKAPGHLRYQYRGEIGNSEGEVMEFHYLSTDISAPALVLFND